MSNDPPPIDDYRELARIIRQCAEGHDRFVVGIDGCSGAGNSSLARKLEKAIGVSVIDVDKHSLLPGGLAKASECYAENVDYDKLPRLIDGRDGIIAIACICLDRVMSYVGRALDLRVYVKAMQLRPGMTTASQHERDADDAWEWRDENMMANPEGWKASVAIANREREEARAAFPEIRSAHPILELEVIRNHHAMKPQCHADFVYLARHT